MINGKFYKPVLYMIGLTILVTSISACNLSDQSGTVSITVPSAQSVNQSGAVSITVPSTQSENQSDATPVTVSPAQSVVQSPSSEFFDGVYAYAGLIELKQADPSFIIDLKNATSDNITGRIQYEYDFCLIHVDAAKLLIKAQKLAMADGYRIKVWDAYRPQSVQTAMNACLPDDQKKFVPALSDYSQHCRGIAVDITLVDENGVELDMPTGYCDFTDAAYSDYDGATETQTQNREYLKRIMAKAGFKVLSKEWWHYYLPSYKEYEQLDITFGDYLHSREADMTVPDSILP